MSCQPQEKCADAPITAKAPDDFPEQPTEASEDPQGHSITDMPNETCPAPELPAAARSRPPSYRSVSPPRYSHTATQPVVTPLAVEPIAEEDIEDQSPTASDDNTSTKQDRRRCRFRISRGCRGFVSWLCSGAFWFPFCFAVWVLSFIALFAYALGLSIHRNQDESLKPHDQCYKKQEVAGYLAGFLGWISGIDQWYAHHWALAVFKSSWVILLLVRIFLASFVEFDPSLNLDDLDIACVLAALVASLWWPIDTVLWLKGVYSVPGFEGGGGF
ncbi:hypothetical protein ASPACDRAFT_1858629 [Aspergillus aculeatus ATCC 16872]|uniref:Uncharacterized protein n=1 Tax=Aspergillus aculeatus (strain ATCC 16872 / CBS 172.66 / WB 5094) TaxID=690307 RepID=A0A1L9WLX9_ASPA1|nr:uncharacterized protein ASPACDRAFT_1858629 [Aspergillus aculeatus ATCC 16872]OJJ97167.1 hypothetical protein ASPACDRAFT_1858629 [Aspergillus aculeatus ATCC 16872]